MNPTTSAITALFNRIPRRHSLENFKEINSIIGEYESLLINIEGENAFYEKNINTFFDDLDKVRTTIKRSADNKASKKTKDSLFDEGSGILKDNMQALLEIYADGKRIA